MQRLISFSTIKKYCLYVSDVHHGKRKVNLCVYEDDIKSYFKRADRCNEKNCRIWKNLRKPVSA